MESVRLATPQVRNSILRCDAEVSVWRRYSCETAYYGAIFLVAEHRRAITSELGFRGIKGTHCRYRTAQDKRNATVRWQAIAISNLSAWPLARNSFGALGYFVSVTASREV